MFNGIVIFSLETFALIFAFYGVVALGGQDAILGVVLLVAALVSGMLGFVLTMATRRQESESPLEIHFLGRQTFQMDIDDLRT